MHDDIDLASLRPTRFPTFDNQWISPAPSGPKTHRLESLVDVGAVIDIIFNIHQHKESPLSITETPHQFIKPLSREIGKRARTKAANNSRTKALNLKEIDQTATNASLETLDSKQRDTIMIAIKGSTWTADNLFKLGKANSPICTLCGTGDDQTFEPRIWECARFHDARHECDHNLASMPSAAIPKSIKHGIAPILQADLIASYWGSKVIWFKQEDKALLGADYPQQVNYSITKAAFDDNDSFGRNDLNARQLFQKMRQQDIKLEQQMQPTFYDQELAPDEPNVYTDGAISSPKSNSGALWDTESNATIVT